MNPRKFGNVVACLGLICAAMVAAAEAEPVPTLKASEILPPDLLKSDVHTVNENVELDRLLCVYDVQTPFGLYKVTSTEMLKIRVHEFQVLKSAKNMSGTEEFFGSMKDSVVQVPMAVVDTVFHPIASVKKMGEGVKSKFSAVGRFFTSGREKSEYEDGTLKEASLGKFKRTLAVELSVDVYSTNPNIQKLLDHIARAQSMGGMPVRLAGMAAPMGVGIALTMLGMRRDVNTDLAMKSPSELHAMNRKILEGLGIDKDLIETFLDNKYYSPRHKTVITANLEAMKNVEGLENFLITSFDDKTEEEALHAERQSDMFLYWHKKLGKLDRIGRIGRRLPAAITRNNELLIVGPVDHLYVDDQGLETMKTLIQIREDTKCKKVILALTGTASDRVKAKAQEVGFTIRENFFLPTGR